MAHTLNLNLNIATKSSLRRLIDIIWCVGDWTSSKEVHNHKKQQQQGLFSGRASQRARSFTRSLAMGILSIPPPWCSGYCLLDFLVQQCLLLLRHPKICQALFFFSIVAWRERTRLSPLLLVLAALVHRALWYCWDMSLRCLSFSSGIFSGTCSTFSPDSKSSMVIGSLTYGAGSFCLSGASSPARSSMFWSSSGRFYFNKEHSTLFWRTLLNSAGDQDAPSLSFPLATNFWPAFGTCI